MTAAPEWKAPDVAEDVEPADSVSMAMPLALETLPPTEPVTDPGGTAAAKSPGHRRDGVICDPCPTSSS
ncbi:hypothetical protein [Nonomuraea sp. NPDC005650]|uniref:hypothetical protein n=1 Tax=Nonomuraea sp. NPDC005650 TaxID=3157045 RepID=UPI00339FB9EF